MDIFWVRLVLSKRFKKFIMVNEVEIPEPIKDKFDMLFDFSNFL